MTASLTDLVTLITKDQAKSTILSLMKGLDFPVTAWQPGNPSFKIIDAFCDLTKEVRESVQLIAKGGYLDLASGGWLTLLAKGQYFVDRKPAVFAEGKATLSAISGAGPYVITPGQLVASDATGKRFINTTGGTLTAGPSALQLTWKAEQQGAPHNLIPGALSILNTPLAGVSISNPDLGGNTWLTVVGVDEESDADLRARCRLRWATLAIQAPADAYKFWALEASTAVTRVYVDDQNPDGPGTFTVYLAGPVGFVAPSFVSAVDAYLQPKRQIGAILTTASATNSPISLAATIHAPASLGLTVGKVQDAWNAYFRTLPIGGLRIPALAPSRIFRDQLEKVTQSLGDGIVVDLTTPASDLSLGNNQVAVPSYGAINIITY